MNNNDKKTCGELYLENVREFCRTAEERMFFTAGAVVGQAEKVYLVACPAAMFRPTDGNFALVLDIVGRVARRFGLQSRVITYSWAAKPGDDGFPGDNSAREIWIFRAREGYHFGRWLQYPVNSVMWHVHRASDCGIPNSEVDPFFHERAGFSKPADDPLTTGATNTDDLRAAYAAGISPMVATDASIYFNMTLAEIAEEWKAEPVQLLKALDRFKNG